MASRNFLGEPKRNDSASRQRATACQGNQISVGRKGANDPVAGVPDRAGSAKLPKRANLCQCDLGRALLNERIELCQVNWFDEMMFKSRVTSFLNVFLHSKTRESNAK